MFLPERREVLRYPIEFVGIQAAASDPFISVNLFRFGCHFGGYLLIGREVLQIVYILLTLSKFLLVGFDALLEFEFEI